MQGKCGGTLVMAILTSIYLHSNMRKELCGGEFMLHVEDCLKV